MRDVLVNEPKSGKAAPTPEPDFGWYLLGWAGWIFLLVGSLDIALTWVPLNLGNVEWEFGTITRTLDSLPLPFLGSALILGAAAARGLLWWGRVSLLVFTLVLLGVLATGVLYALNVPIALKAVQQPQILVGLKKAIAKSVFQVALYAVGSATLIRIGSKRFLRKAN